MKLLLDASGATQADLARGLGISRSAVNRWFHRGVFRRRTALRVREELGRITRDAMGAKVRDAQTLIGARAKDAGCSCAPAGGGK